MKNFSIIIPSRNITTLLERLLESIPRRNDIQVIVVDDNSDSTVVDFDNYPGLKDSNVEVIFTKEGKGAGYARNIGLKHAIGRWVIFADSDDCFITDKLNLLMDKYVDSDFDLVFCNIVCLEIESENIVTNANKQYIDIIESCSKDRIERCRYTLRPPWGKMIKRDLIVENNVWFDETPVANDIMFSLKIGHLSKKATTDTTKVYKWFVRKNSITSNQSLDAALIHFNKGVERNTFLENCGVSQYRGCAFISIPHLVRSGVKLLDAIKMAIKNTPSKYMLRDIFYSIKWATSKL